MQNAIKGRIGLADDLPQGWKLPHEWWDQYGFDVESIGYGVFATERAGVTVAEVQRHDEDEFERYSCDDAAYTSIVTQLTPVDMLALYLDGRPSDVRCPLPSRLVELLEGDHV